MEDRQLEVLICALRKLIEIWSDPLSNDLHPVIEVQGGRFMVTYRVVHSWCSYKVVPSLCT